MSLEAAKTGLRDKIKTEIERRNRPQSQKNTKGRIFAKKKRGFSAACKAVSFKT